MPHVMGRRGDAASPKCVRSRGPRAWAQAIAALAFAALMLGSAGCLGPKRTEFASPPAVGPHGGAKLAAPTTPAEDLPRVDTSALVAREKDVWWRLVSQLYAPCSDQAVSIAQCVKEARSCKACAPAARLLAEKVREGATAEEAEAAYAVRFGPNVKAVEPGDSPSHGPATAPVTVVVWSDFECPHCRAALPMLDDVIEKYSPNVRLVHKFYALHQHTHADAAARAAIAAKNQGKYWEMEKALFEHQHDLDPADLDKYARELKLDPVRFAADIKADKTTQLLARDRDEADKAGLTGTPFIVINGREFNFSYFHFPDDLGPWIALELELKGGAHPQASR